MLEELRLNPRSPGARSCGRRPGGRVFTGKAAGELRLSTGFAEPMGPPLHNAAATGGSPQEVMG
jgi:hypothetical protein